MADTRARPTKPDTTHPCPSGCGCQVPHYRYACPYCWARLPEGIKERIRSTHRRDLAAHGQAMRAARLWFADNPLRPGEHTMVAQAVPQRCERTELLVDQCAHCKGQQSIEEQASAEALEARARLIVTGQWFPAKYAGKCGRCGEPFPEGAAIRSDNNHPLWVAECCAGAGELR